MALRRVSRSQPPTLLTFVESSSIEDKKKGDLVPFKTWDAQREVLADFEKYDHNIVLKARQLGLTWLALIYWLYHTTFWGHRTILLCSKREDEGKEMLRRVRVLHTTLPEEWQAPVLSGDDSKLSMSFLNGSRFIVLPATPTMARTYAAYGAVIDEMAFMPYQSEAWAALTAAAQRIMVVSTGYRRADVYYDTWQGAVAGENEFHPIFLPWWSDPTRDEDWYERNVLRASRPRLARREFCRNDDEAFSSAEGLFFERFDREHHVDGFDIQLVAQRNGRVYRAVDFGWQHAVCLWLCPARNGQIWVLGELDTTRKTTGEFAAAVLSKDRELKLKPLVSYCDPAGYAKNVQTATSEIEIFQQAGLNPVAKLSANRDGCMLIGEHLASSKHLMIHSDCHGLINAFESLEPDKKAPDIYAADQDFDHAMDALRYGIVNIASGVAGHFSDISRSAERYTDDPVTSGLYHKQW
jgi:hypothetical protein